MFDISKFKQDADALKGQLSSLSSNNQINGQPLSNYIFNKMLTKMDPIEYCQRVLRAHLPAKKQKLHENQIELIRAVCNPKIRSVAALMA